MENFKKWIAAAGMRAIKTFAQVCVTLIGTQTVGFTDLDWVHIVSVAGVSAVLSLLTSVAGLPELKMASVGEVGTFEEDAPGVE